MKAWVATLSDECHVTIDDGGLCLIEVGDDGVPTGPRLDVEHTPDADD